MRKNRLTLLFFFLCACDPTILEKTGFKEPDPITLERIISFPTAPDANQLAIQGMFTEATATEAN